MFKFFMDLLTHENELLIETKHTLQGGSGSPFSIALKADWTEITLIRTF